MDLETIRAERARRSLREFVAQAWHVVEPATPFAPGWHIDAICEHLEAVTRGEIRNLVVNMPPRHMKSLAISVFWPAWVWATQPEKRWIFASYAQALATRDSLKCRHIIQSPWYRARWDDVYQLSDEQNAKMRFENNRRGYRLATSVGGVTTGEGGDVLVVDDPHNVLQAESDAIRQSVLDWWDMAMSTRGNDPATVARVVVMQRVHEQDLSGHVFEQGGYEHLCLPAEYEGAVWVKGSPLNATGGVTGIGWRDPRTQDGELLWSERFNARDLAELKTRLGSYGASAQLQQRPSPAAGGLLKRDWWRFAAAPPDQFDAIAMSWDCAFKDLEDSDYVVGQVWGRVGARRYLLDQVRGQMGFPATITAVTALAAKWPQAHLKLIEDKANGTAVIQTLQARTPGIVAVNPEGGKVARAHAVSPFIEAGNVFLPEPNGAPWVSDFIEECAAFPRGAHDDQVDAMTQMLNHWNNPTEQQWAILTDGLRVCPTCGAKRMVKQASGQWRCNGCGHVAPPDSLAS